MTPLERILLEALEALYPVAIKVTRRTGADIRAMDKADDAISLAHRTANGDYHSSIREST